MKQPVGCIAALLALAAGVAITAPGQASSAPPVNELTWWALGDSYSAGEGLQTVDHEVNPPGVL